MELTDEMLGWIDQHYNDDENRLRLKYHGAESQVIDFMILQIECRKKTSKKLSRTLKNRKFIFPTTLSAEQCTSDDLAEVHASFVVGDVVLDMTCGLGIDAYAMARRGCVVTAVEINENVAEAARINAKINGLDNISIINKDSVSFLRSTSDMYDTIFIDPARRGNDGKRLYALRDCEPDIISILPEIKNRCRRLVIKASPMLDVSQMIRELGAVNDIYVIGTDHECKEVVAVVDFESNCITKFHSITIGHDGKVQEYSFYEHEERSAVVEYGDPTIGGYLYEPYPSIMKSAPMRLLSQKFGISKLHVNTHLFTSKAIVDEFPGNRFVIERVIPFSSKILKSIKDDYPKINVAVRNFILTADELKSKLKVKDGGDKRLFGVTTGSNNRILLVVSRC